MCNSVHTSLRMLLCSPLKHVMKGAAVLKELEVEGSSG